MQEAAALKDKEKERILSLLHPKVLEAFKKKGFKELTEPQARTIPLILSGKNVLLIAPTGTGKTEAALLPVFSLLLREKEKSKEEKQGISVLYITPLRALNRDLLERIEWWAQELGLNAAVRHGDTDQRERARQSRNPPDILITTPETLQAILSGKKLREHVKCVKWVIVDEVHEIAEDKRGSQLALALERLRYIKGEDFQVVGLSATVGSPEKVAKFLVGVGRDVEVVKVDVTRLMDIRVVYPAPKAEDTQLAEKMYVHPEVAARLRLIRELLESHRSVLVFTNTRTMAEVLSSRFKVWDQNLPIGVHHGSLSKLSRESAEREFKREILKCLVCTSSLELGIDIGSVDLVIQYMSPRQVTRIVQRVGRSGHRIGRKAKGIIITADEDDTLEAAVIAKRAMRGELEPLTIPEKPLDVLCHQIVALFQLKRRWKISEILDLYGRAYPYRDLTEEELKQVLEYMHERYPRLAWVSFEDGTVLKPKRTRPLYEYFFEHLSMIPDEKHYLVVNAEDGSPIGVLDEPFIAEYGEIGVKFVFRGSLWQIKDIVGDRVYVQPVSDPTGAVPSWVGEEIPVPYEVAAEVGRIKRRIVEELERGRDLESIAKDLSKEYPISAEDLARALKPIEKQFRQGLPVPTDKLVVAEITNGKLILFTHIGTLANRALARLLGDKISEYAGASVGVQQDAYVVVIQLQYGELNEDIVRRALSELSLEDLSKLMREKAKRFGLFKRRLIHVARRFGALKKGIDYGSISMRKLVEMFEGTVIFKEALNEFLSKDVDVENLATFLRELTSGKRTLIIYRTREPSPLAELVLTKLARKIEIVPPERLSRIVIESTKARLHDEVIALVCLNCMNLRIGRVREFIGTDISCEKCGSKKIGVIKEEESTIKRILEKGLKARARKEKRLIEKLQKTANLVEKYGYKALIALASESIKLSQAEEILEKYADRDIDDNFYELIVKAEKENLKQRFW